LVFELRNLRFEVADVLVLAKYFHPKIRQRAARSKPSELHALGIELALQFSSEARHAVRLGFAQMRGELDRSKPPERPRRAPGADQLADIPGQCRESLAADDRQRSEHHVLKRAYTAVAVESGKLGKPQSATPPRFELDPVFVAHQRPRL